MKLAPTHGIPGRKPDPNCPKYKCGADRGYAKTMRLHGIGGDLLQGLRDIVDEDEDTL